MKRMLRILQVSNSYTPYKGGVVSSIKATIQSLSSAGHSVLLVTFNLSREQSTDKIYFLYSPFHFTYKENPIALPWFSTLQLEDIIKSFNPDIIHVHHPFLLGPASVACAKKYNIASVFTYHTRYHDYVHYIPLPSSLTKAACNFLLDRFCTQVDGIIVPSYELKQELPDRYSVPLYHIASPILHHFELPYRPKKYLASVKLITVSRLVPEKNIVFLLQLIKRLDPIRYTLTLIGYGWYEETLKEVAYDVLRLTPQQVIFKKVSDKHELAKAYQEADIFLFSSLTETQGLVLAEAMACSTPVIALNGPGQREIVKQGYNGFLCDSIEHMAQCIQEVASSQTLLETLSFNAWQTAQRYHITHFSEQLDACYNDILKRKRS